MVVNNNYSHHHKLKGRVTREEDIHNGKTAGRVWFVMDSNNEKKSAGREFAKSDQVTRVGSQNQITRKCDLGVGILYRNESPAMPRGKAEHLHGSLCLSPKMITKKASRHGSYILESCRQISWARKRREFREHDHNWQFITVNWRTGDTMWRVYKWGRGHQIHYQPKD